MPVSHKRETPWLLLVFSLPLKQASQRVEVWRKLQRYGGLQLGSSGYVLPHTPANLEHFEWLAAFIRKYKGQASVLEVQSIDDMPSEKLTKLFNEARARDYELLMRVLKKLGSKSGALTSRRLTRVRQRFQEIIAIDFFNSPLRSRVENLLARATETESEEVRAKRGKRSSKEYMGRIWMTRHRPGIDRVSSAWLIKTFIDPKAKFIFGSDPAAQPEAIPFDMFHAEGFGHRGNDCTFETLVKEFGIADPKAVAISQMIHDADLGDEKFARTEGTGLDRVLIGWAQQGISDDEILHRGMQLIEGLYHALS
ncbi:MAG TPA: chromate resistance protein ChrB domain-containing protein [Terriglobales bacterium]|jgi:hypothetical protein|nr:chromate resistance protein ChrB domain-containing protein [Terriglobales bacterium]